MPGWVTSQYLIIPRGLFSLFFVNEWPCLAWSIGIPCIAGQLCLSGSIGRLIVRILSLSSFCFLPWTTDRQVLLLKESLLLTERALISNSFGQYAPHEISVNRARQSPSSIRDPFQLLTPSKNKGRSPLPGRPGIVASSFFDSFLPFFFWSMSFFLLPLHGCIPEVFFFVQRNPVQSHPLPLLRRRIIRSECLTINAHIFPFFFFFSV